MIIKLKADSDINLADCNDHASAECSLGGKSLGTRFNWCLDRCLMTKIGHIMYMHNVTVTPYTMLYGVHMYMGLAQARPIYMYMVLVF